MKYAGITAIPQSILLSNFKTLNLLIFITDHKLSHNGRVKVDVKLLETH